MPFTEEQIKALKKPLGKSRVKQRSQSGRSFSYIEGYDAIDTANEIFGFDGWSMAVSDVRVLVEGERATVYQAIVRIHAGDAVREDVGVGITAGQSNEAHETAIKAAVTDAMKRALRTFGAQFGNSLYGDSPELAEPAPPRCEEHDAPLMKGRTGKWGHVLEGGEACIPAA